jgi:hypothetical protein
LPEFTPYRDKSLGGIVVKNERQRQAAMKVRRLIDARDFNDVESVEKTAWHNLKQRLQKRDEYLEECIARAVYKAEHGYSDEYVVRELEHRLLEGRKESEYEQKRMEEKANG